MAIALLIAGVAVAALCVWLTVRIVNRRERWAKRTAISIALLVLYVGSWIPAASLASWLAARSLLPGWAATALSIFYLPIQFAVALLLALWFSIFGG
jgi:hypothetical protein